MPHSRVSLVSSYSFFALSFSLSLHFCITRMTTGMAGAQMEVPDLYANFIFVAPGARRILPSFVCRKKAAPGCSLNGPSTNESQPFASNAVIKIVSANFEIIPFFSISYSNIF